MTSTKFNVGLSDDTRNSSRVLRPPGGGHTDIFGGDPEPPRGRRLNPAAASATSLGEYGHPPNGAASHNGAQETPPAVTPEAAPEPKVEAPAPAPAPEVPRAEPVKVAPEAPKRVRVPPGGFSSGLCPGHQPPETGLRLSRMQGGTGGRQSRLLSRLLSKLRGERLDTLDKRQSATSSGISEGVCCSSSANEDDTDPLSTVASTCSANPPFELPPSPFGPSRATFVTQDEHRDPFYDEAQFPAAPLDDSQFAANIDLRYGGQYLSPDQLPEFCEQLHHLVEVIRNIHSYARITGEYPSSLERRLEQEAREVAALAAEARNARDVVSRARTQRRAVRTQRKQLLAHLVSLKETEVRELESSIRLSDRKLYKTWESLKDSIDPAAFEPLLDEIRNKQSALENLVRLVDGRRASLARSAAAPTPLPAPESLESSDDPSSVPGRKRFDGSRRAGKKKRGSSREPRSVPLSGEPSRHGPPVQDSESTSRYRVGSAGAVALAPLELPSHGSVRDILFFTVN